MKKILLAALAGVFFFTSWCWAQNHYAFVQVQIKNDSGTTFLMNTITKVSDKETCENILSPVRQLKDMYSIITECLTGQEWEDSLRWLFANQPASTVYISYVDPNGYETRINTKVLAGSNSLISDLPVDPPIKEAMLWANAMIKALNKGGIKNARIIYPAKK